MRITTILSLALISVVAVEAADRTNVLLITADDLGIQLPVYGDSTIETPNIDALAARSVVFKTAYIAQASCSSSRSAMLTGLYPHANGQYGLANANVGFELHEPLRDNVLPNVLKRNGYRTGIIGKLHVNPEKVFQFDKRYKTGFGSRDVQLQVEQAAEFWGETGDEPWFLMFNVFDPHVARDQIGQGVRGPQYFPDVVKGIPADPLTTADIKPWPWQKINRDAQLKKIAGYYNCVKRIDVAIGRLMDALQATGDADNTLIIFLGDHGPPFARGKSSCYEAGLRVPFIVSWPGVSNPHLSDRLVSAVDIVPTALDAAGVEPPGPVHGASLRSVLSENRNRSARWRDTLVGEFQYHGAGPLFVRRAITDGRYKLIHNPMAGQSNAPASIDGDKAPEWAAERGKDDPIRQAFARLADPPEWELYDLKSDPWEYQNLVTDNAVQDQRQRLATSLAQWQQRTNDRFRDPSFRARVSARYKK